MFSLVFGAFYALSVARASSRAKVVRRLETENEREHEHTVTE